MAKSILVTGATGKQGGAVLTALANNADFTILAVTRNASGESAQKLKSKGNNVTVVQGDLNDVPALFNNAREAAKSPIWGVYSVQLSQGTGVTHEGEIKQGKDMIDESIKAGVKHFVYSSVERGGDEASWENPTPVPHFQSKYDIERYLRDKAGSMGWTILRPGEWLLSSWRQYTNSLSCFHGQSCTWIPITSLHSSNERHCQDEAVSMGCCARYWHLR